MLLLRSQRHLLLLWVVRSRVNQQQLACLLLRQLQLWCVAPASHSQGRQAPLQPTPSPQQQLLEQLRLQVQEAC